MLWRAGPTACGHGGAGKGTKRCGEALWLRWCTGSTEDRAASDDVGSMGRRNAGLRYTAARRGGLFLAWMRGGLCHKAQWLAVK